MDLNAVIQHTGGASSYIVAVVCLTCLLNLTVNIENAAVNFLSPGVEDYWCNVPALANLTVEEQINISSPCNGDSCNDRDHCKVYDLPWDDYSEDDFRKWGPEFLANFNTTSCKQWNYGIPLAETTTSEFNLVCERSWISELLSPIYLAGLFVGSMISGPVADSYGRMPAFVLCIILLAIGGVGSALSVNIVMFAAFRFLLGVSGRLGGITNVILATELVAQEYRSASVGLSRIFYVTGPLLLAGAAYLTDSWRILQLVLTMPFVLLILCYWYIPESPRWLVGKGRYNEARKSINIIARRSKKTIPDKIALEAAENNNSTKQQEPISVKEVFRHPLLRKWTIALGIAHLASMMVYMAVSMNIDRLFGNLYLNVILASVLEYPAVLLCLYSMAKFGRQRTMQAGLAVAAIGGLISVACILTDVPPMAVTIALIIVRGAASVGVCSFTTLTTELFPSNIRQTALGVTSAFSSFFTIFSPLIGGPLEQVWEPLPSLIFAVLCSGSFCLNLMIPETLGKPMPESLEDLEILNDPKRFSSSPFLDANHNPLCKDCTDKTQGLSQIQLQVDDLAHTNQGFEPESVSTYL